MGFERILVRLRGLQSVAKERDTCLMRSARTVLVTSGGRLKFFKCVIVLYVAQVTVVFSTNTLDNFPQIDVLSVPVDVM